MVIEKLTAQELRRRKRKLRKNIKVACEERQQRVAELYCAQKSQWEIAEELGVSQPTVSNDLAAIRAKWLANSVMNMSERLAKEIAALDNLERIAMQAWLRSCEDAEEVTTMKSPPRLNIKLKNGDELKKKTSDKPKVTSEITKIKGQSGNPAFLAEARQCVEKRCKLLGLLDERSINVNNNTAMTADFTQLFARKDDPQLAEKRAPIIAASDDPLEKELKHLEERAGIQREVT